MDDESSKLPPRPDVEAREILTQFLKLKPEPVSIKRSAISDNSSKALQRLVVSGLAGHCCWFSITEQETGKRLRMCFRYSGNAASQVYEQLNDTWTHHGGNIKRYRTLQIDDEFQAYLTIEGEKARWDAIHDRALFLHIVRRIKATPVVQQVGEEFFPGHSVWKRLFKRSTIITSAAANSCASVGNITQQVVFPPNAIVVNVTMSYPDKESPAKQTTKENQVPHPWHQVGMPEGVEKLFRALERFPDGASAQDLKGELDGVEPASLWTRYKKWAKHLDRWIQRQRDSYRLRRTDEVAES